VNFQSFIISLHTMFTSQKEVLFVRTFYYVTPVANLDFFITVDKLEVSTARSLRHPATKNLPIRGVKHYIATIRV